MTMEILIVTTYTLLNNLYLLFYIYCPNLKHSFTHSSM